MTYTEAIQQLYQKLPAFHLVGKKAYKADLGNTLALCEALGNPHQQLKCVHIAGTNGKGSTSHLLASMLQEAGLKVGLYTSPHLKDFTERIKINGQAIPQAIVVQFVEQFLDSDIVQQVKPSFFELTVALMFSYFAKEQVDIAVIEVGMGGRLDSTNVIMPLLSVITNIGFDHMEFLGDTLPLIATEKAGIIKSKIPVVISEYHPETAPVFVQKAQAESAPLFWAKDWYTLQPLAYNADSYLNFTLTPHHPKAWQLTQLTSPLAGYYQRYNIAAALTAMQVLQEYYPTAFSLSPQQALAGIRNCVANTQLKGRWQILGHQPLRVADVAHNEAGVKVVLEQLAHTPYKQLHIIWGMVRDKDFNTILALLPKQATYYFTQAQTPRALEVQTLWQEAQKYGLKGQTYTNVDDAWQTAKAKANPKDCVLAMGSIFVVAEIEEL